MAIAPDVVVDRGSLIQMIQPNANPETAAVIGSSWPEHDEDAFRADAESQRAMAESASTGATAVSTAGAQTANTLTGAAGSMLQDRLGQDTNALTAAGDRHAEAATHLDSAVINIAEAKAAMNTVDADYHTQVASLTARATAEGWTTAETTMARTDLLTQAQQAIANIRAGFDGAYEGVVAALTATSGATAPTVAPGTVELPPAGAAPTAHQMGQSTGSAAVDFAAGMLSGVTGQSGGASGMGVGGGVYAPGYGGMGALGGMGAGYGVLAPGYGGMGSGYDMSGMGMGMGGMGMGGMGMGAQPTPLNQIGQAVGGIAQSVLGGGQAALAGQAGVGGQANLSGLLGGQAATPGQAAAPSGLAALLQQGGLQGDLNGAASASAELTTDLSSATSGEDVEKALEDAIDAVAADPDGDGIPGDTAADADGDTADEETPETEPDPEGADADGADAAEATSGEDDENTPAEKPEDGSIPARPITDTETPTDPVTRLQTDVNNAIAGAATAAQSGVDGAADTARSALSTQVGFVTTGDDGSVRADTIGLQGPQHIEAIRTETSAADLGARDTGPAAAPAATPAASAAPYGAGTPMMAPTAGPGAPAAPVASAPGASSAPVGRPTPPDHGRLHRMDDIASPPHTPSAVDTPTSAAAPSFLSLLRGPVAGAHTRLALLRVQQFTNNAVTASAVGVFEDGAATTYILATAHGVSYLPHDGAIPTDTRLLSELADDRFYGHWCGHSNPVAKLTDLATRDHTLGQLSYVLTSLEGVHVPGIEVVTQSLSDVKSLVESDLLAPSSRSRRDLVLAHDTNLGDEVRDMAMRTQVMRGDQYLHVLGRASGALWSNDADQAPYLEHWMRVLTADALRAADRGSAPDAWFAVEEYRRVERIFAPAH